MYIRNVIYEPGGKAAEFSHLACNLYAGCDHGCSYCYVPAILHARREEFIKCRPRPWVLKSLAKYAPKYSNKNSRVLLCFSCDPYPQVSEGITSVAGKALRILRENNVPFQILTKGGSRAIPDFDLYGPNDAFASTLTFIDNTDSKKYEPGAALPQNRIDTLQAAKEAFGIHTWVSLEPVIEPEQTLELIRRTHQFIDLYKVGKLNYTKNTINWQVFGRKVLDLLKSLNKPYFIKADLAKYLHDDEYKNTDNRTVKGCAKESI